MTRKFVPLMRDLKYFQEGLGWQGTVGYRRHTKRPFAYLKLFGEHCPAVQMLKPCEAVILRKWSVQTQHCAKSHPVPRQDIHTKKDYAAILMRPCSADGADSWVRLHQDLQCCAATKVLLTATSQDRLDLCRRQSALFRVDS